MDLFCRVEETCLYKLITRDTDGDISVRGLYRVEIGEFSDSIWIIVLLLNYCTYVVKSKLENYWVHLAFFVLNVFIIIQTKAVFI